MTHNKQGLAFSSPFNLIKWLENVLKCMDFNFSKFLSSDSSVWCKKLCRIIENLSVYCLRNKQTSFTYIWTPVDFSSRLSEIQGVYVVLNPELFEKKPIERGCRDPGPMVERLQEFWPYGKDVAGILALW